MWLLKQKKKKVKSNWSSNLNPFNNFLIFHPRTWKHQNKKKLLKTVFICQKSSFTAPRFSTCKVSQHVKYKPYNTLESKRVPKSTVKITLPSLEMWRGWKKKKKTPKGKVKPKNDRIKKKKKKGKVTFQLFSVQMVFCHKRGRVMPSVSVQPSVSLDHWSPEGRHTTTSHLTTNYLQFPSRRRLF